MSDGTLDLVVVGAGVSGRISHVIPPNPYNRFYLETKASRSGHYIDFAGKPHMPEQGEAVVVEGMPSGGEGPAGRDSTAAEQEL